MRSQLPASFEQTPQEDGARAPAEQGAPTEAEGLQAVGGRGKLHRMALWALVCLLLVEGFCLILLCFANMARFVASHIPRHAYTYIHACMHAHTHMYTYHTHTHTHLYRERDI